MIRRVFMFHLIFTAILLVPVYFFLGYERAQGALVGAILMGANIIALIWAWRRIIDKKSLVLAGSVIVFKYAILALVLYFSIALKWVDLVGFVIGMATVFPSIITWGYKENELRQPGR